MFAESHARRSSAGGDYRYPGCLLTAGVMALYHTHDRSTGYNKKDRPPRGVAFLLLGDIYRVVPSSHL